MCVCVYMQAYTWGDEEWLSSYTKAYIQHVLLHVVNNVYSCTCCSSMIPGSRNPMWGEEFNFSVDELPAEVSYSTDLSNEAQVLYVFL